MVYRMGWRSTNIPTTRPTPRPMFRPGYARIHGVWQSPSRGQQKVGTGQIARRNYSQKTQNASNQMIDAQNDAQEKLNDYEGCVKRKFDKGWKRNDMFPCRALTGAGSVIHRMGKKGTPGKCDKEGVTIANCHVDYNQWQKKSAKATEKRQEYAALAAAEDGVPRNYANAQADEILYESDPVGYTKQKQSEYDRYVADVGMDPPSDLAMTDYVASTAGEEEAGSIVPILLGVAGVGAFGFLAWTMFSD